MDCKHERLELRGHIKPKELSENALWINDLSLVCFDCGTYLMNNPEDLTRIINIPHPIIEECTHPFNVRAYTLGGFGFWQCLQCGKTGVSSPTHKLEVKSTIQPGNAPDKDR